MENFRQLIKMHKQRIAYNDRILIPFGYSHPFLKYVQSSRLKQNRITTNSSTKLFCSKNAKWCIFINKSLFDILFWITANILRLSVAAICKRKSTPMEHFAWNVERIVANWKFHHALTINLIVVQTNEKRSKNC